MLTRGQGTTSLQCRDNSLALDCTAFAVPSACAVAFREASMKFSKALRASSMLFSDRRVRRALQNRRATLSAGRPHMGMFESRGCEIQWRMRKTPLAVAVSKV
jgi:hypothetical protein